MHKRVERAVRGLSIRYPWREMIDNTSLTRTIMRYVRFWIRDVLEHVFGEDASMNIRRRQNWQTNDFIAHVEKKIGAS